jgi:hypothetical protein
MVGRSSRARRKTKETRQAWVYLIIAIVVFGLIAAAYVSARRANRTLDTATLCPSEVSSVTVLLVDVTDPMNLPQRQDFLNQLERLRNSIPRYGKLVVMKVDPISDRLLEPIMTRCSPGTARDVSEMTGNKSGVQRKWDEEFRKPLDRAFTQLLSASGAERSPILESIQSANLTYLEPIDESVTSRRLIIASDLLQNTDAISFYGQLPDPADLTASQAFSRVRTDLRGVNVELWMLQRGDSGQTQPRNLPDLWDRIISTQGGEMTRLYTVSG